jgi:hypothetical protein
MDERSPEGLNMNLEGSRGLYGKFLGLWWIQNMEENERSMCKIEGLGVDLWLEFKN